MAARVPPPIEHALALYRGKLAERFGDRFRGMRLYGSWARGEQGPDSDVDLLVLIDRMVFADWREAVFLASDAGMETDLLISAQPCDPARYEALVARAEPFFAAVDREGIPRVTAEQFRGNAADEIARGEAALAEADKLLSVDLFYGAASRAYYAVFHFARALCWAAGETPLTHHGVVHLLRVRYIRSGKLPPDTDRRYTSLQTFREQADYSSSFTIDRDGAVEAVANARLLTGTMAALLREMGA